MSIITLGYDDVFDDFSKVDIHKLIADIPSANLLQVVGHFSAQIHTQAKSKTQQLEFLRMWVGRLPQDSVKRMNEFIRFVSGLPDAKFNFISNISNSILAEYALANFNPNAAVKDLTSAQELNLLKAYLYCTQLWLNRQKLKVADDSIHSLAKMLITNKLPFDEILQLKDFRIQFVKAIFFFKYCETHPVFKGYIDIFCKEHQVSSWREYLSSLLGAYIRKFDEQKTPSVLRVGDDHKIMQDFLRQFRVTPAGYARTDDFIALREKPILELEPDTFLFMSLNFFVDKIFQGTQFALAKVLIKNKATYKNKPIKDFPQFKSIYGEEISEKGIFCSIMDYVFGKSYLNLNGHDLKEKIGDGACDYYLRREQEVLLIEYKDVLLNAEVKHSYDYQAIEKELFKKLVSNQSAKDKGVAQLANSVKEFRNGTYKAADSGVVLDALIYPVLIVTDNSLSVPGINYVLNLEFKRIITEKGIDPSKISSLVVVALDELLRLQDFFRNGKLDFLECLKEYVKMVQNPGSRTESVIDFTGYMRFKTRNEKDFTPELLRREVKGMLKNNAGDITN